jgi:hypothetical protein
MHVHHLDVATAHEASQTVYPPRVGDRPDVEAMGLHTESRELRREMRLPRQQIRDFEGEGILVAQAGVFHEQAFCSAGPEALDQPQHSRAFVVVVAHPHGTVQRRARTRHRVMHRATIVR